MKGDVAAPAEPARKKNFFERKRFIDYPKPSDSEGSDKAKEDGKPAPVVKQVADLKKEPVKVEEIVSVQY